MTLSGTGKERGGRRPEVGDGVPLGAGAKALGRVAAGRRAKAGAGGGVLRDVPPRAAVAGVPVRVVGRCGDAVRRSPWTNRLPG